MSQERLPIVCVGHVDHGKSTVVGRLLADTNSLPQGKLERVRDYCLKNSKPFEYAFLLDALKEEQSQGITIDVARIFFKTAKREYLLIDAPGHIEFLKNMVSGASHAVAALLVIDAHEGVRENSRRHATMLSYLGISQVVVLVNKMDLCGYSQAAYEALVGEFKLFLAGLSLEAAAFIPVAAVHGEGLVVRSSKTPWYGGPSVLEALDAFRAPPQDVDRALRIPVQGVFKFTASGDERRIIAGEVLSGRLRVGDEVIFFPSGKAARVSTIESFPPGRKIPEAAAGEAVGFTLEQQIYVTRGEVAAIASGQRPPGVTTRLRASVFWLGRKPLARGKDYLLKLGTHKVGCRIEAIERVMDASDLRTLGMREAVNRNEAAECVLALDRPVAMDLAADIPAMGRFVLVDDFEISGGGLVVGTLSDGHEDLRRKVMLRNAHWQRGEVPRAERGERYGHRAGLVLVTGEDSGGRKSAARRLEAQLFRRGCNSYFLGIGSVLYGVDADIRTHEGALTEDFRRLAEVAHILLDSGCLLVVTARAISAADVGVIATALETQDLYVAWVGKQVTTDVAADLTAEGDDATVAAAIEAGLHAAGFLSSPRPG